MDKIKKHKKNIELSSTTNDILRSFAQKNNKTEKEVIVNLIHDYLDENKIEARKNEVNKQNDMINELKKIRIGINKLDLKIETIYTFINSYLINIENTENKFEIFDMKENKSDKLSLLYEMNKKNLESQRIKKLDQNE